MSREKSIKTINIHLEKLTALELEEVTVLTNALLAVRNVREEHQNTIASNKALEKSNLVLSEENAKFVVENIELEKQIIELKSQLEKQQPEIPEFVAEVVENHDLETLANWANLVPLLSTQVRSWLLSSDLVGHSYTYLLADLKINGYTVAKEKRFYLKNKLTGCYLYKAFGGIYAEQSARYINDDEDFNDDCKFTQSEIDSMAAESYEQIEVEE